MNIELDAETLERIRREVIANAKKQLLAEVMSQFNAKQIAGEVKNEAVKLCAQNIMDEIHKTNDVGAIIDKTIQGIEKRLHERVTETLKRGITVRFDDALSSSAKAKKG